MMAVLAWVVSLTAVASQDARAAVPSSADLEAAEKTLREVFKEELSVKTGTAQQKLARKLIEQGQLTRDDAALRFVLFRDAADLAAQAGDAGLLVRALDGLTAAFAVDAVPLRQQYYAKAEAHLAGPGDWRKIGEADLAASAEAAEREQYDAALQLAALAAGASRKGKEMTLAARADAAQRSVAEQRDAMDRSSKAEKTLAAAPEDAAAHSAVGEYLAFFRGRWEEALPHLAKGADPGLRALAEKELVPGAGEAPGLELGDGWWDLAEKERSQVRKKRLVDHALSLYERILPGLSGLSKVRVEKRLGARSPSARRPPLDSQGLAAWWTFDEEGSTVPAQNAMGPTNTLQLQPGVDRVRGRFGSALRFGDGLGHVSGQNLQLPALEVPQTISWWVNLSPPEAGTQTILCFANDTAPAATQVGIQKGQFAVWRHGGATLVAAPLPAPGAWHHGAFVFDGKRPRLYMDGKLAATGDVLPQAGAVNRCEFGRYWGFVGGSPGQYYKGLLDDVRVYARVLTDAEVAELASAKD